MSEAAEIRQLAPEFLRIAYEIAMNEPSEIVRLDQVAESLGTDNFGVSGSAYVDKLTKVAQYLGRKGFLKRQTINWSMFSVTREGIEEAERGVSQAPASTGQGPRDQRRRYLGAIYAITGGNPTQYVSWPEVAPWMGWDRDDQDSFEKGLQIARSLAHSGFITIESDAGSEYRITDEGLAEVEADPSITMPPDILATPDEFSDAAPVGEAPVEIQESLYRFKEDHPDPARVAFIMMEFGQTKAHTAITEAVRSGLDEAGIEGVRADDKRYHDHLFYNVLTYLHGCGLGMAIYERIEAETYNPNVALEVGYLFAMRKPVCLLKDQTLTTLPADLVGRLYDPFDPQDPAGTIPPLVSKWLSDKGLV